MKLLVDAQLPRRLVVWLRQEGFDAVHTLDLPQKNSTSDTAINEISIAEQRVVVTKDSDFVDSFVLRRVPWKLLLVSTGNISNNELIALFQANLNKIRDGFDIVDFIEVDRANVILHF